jgi:hypothetical protein
MRLYSASLLIRVCGLTGLLWWLTLSTGTQRIQRYEGLTFGRDGCRPEIIMSSCGVHQHSRCYLCMMNAGPQLTRTSADCGATSLLSRRRTQIRSYHGGPHSLKPKAIYTSPCGNKHPTSLRHAKNISALLCSFEMRKT